ASAGLSVAGGSINATAGTTFAGPIATLTNAFSGTSQPASDYTATVTWDDGTQDTAVIHPGVNGVYSISDTHTFHHPGTQSFTVSVTGRAGGTASNTGTAAVASAGLSGPLVSISATEGASFSGAVATFTDHDAGATEPASDFAATITWDDGSQSAGTVSGSS